MGTATATFFVEHLFPLGDWRWLVISGVCFATAWWLIHSEAQANNVALPSRARVSKDENEEDLLDDETLERIGVLAGFLLGPTINFFRFLVPSLIGALILFWFVKFLLQLWIQ